MEDMSYLLQNRFKVIFKKFQAALKIMSHKKGPPVLVSKRAWTAQGDLSRAATCGWEKHIPKH